MIYHFIADSLQKDLVLTKHASILSQYKRTLACLVLTVEFNLRLGLLSLYKKQDNQTLF